MGFWPNPKMEVKINMRPEKLTFKDIYQDFKIKFPNLSKGVRHWMPNGYMSIKVFFWDGSEMVYDYLHKRVKFTSLPNAAT